MHHTVLMFIDIKIAFFSIEKLDQLILERRTGTVIPKAGAVPRVNGIKDFAVELSLFLRVI